MDSFLKRRNEEDSQLFSNPKTMKLEDHLSQLPDDCLLDILPRLNHDVLDDVSTLSAKMRILSDLSRTRATRVLASEIRVIQITNEQFIIEISTDQGIFFVDNSNKYDISELMKPCTTRHEFPLTDERPQTQIISEIVANRIIALVERFDFESTIIEGLSIDNHIVRCIEYLSTSRSLRRVGMNECAVDAKLTPEGRTRFLSTLLAIKPAHLFLWCDSLCIDDLFIKEYAETVPLADFHCCDEDSEIIEPNENLWKFKTLNIAHMVVEVHWILPQIWKRLHQKMEGSWWFSLPRQLTLDDIENNLPVDVQNTFWLPDRGEDIFIVEIVGITYTAILCPIYDPIQIRPEWTLKMDSFFKRKSEEDSQLNSKTMRTEDHLYQLTDDCLLDIIPRLDHNDLDEVSTLSEKMRILSDLSRSRAAKVFAELGVIQVTNEQIYIVINTEQGIFFIDNSNQYDISERLKPCTTMKEHKIILSLYSSEESNDFPQTQMISEAVSKRIIALTDRFDFARALFKMVSIDNHFVRCIEHLSTSRSLHAFGMRLCAVDQNISPEERTRFLSALLSMKPTWLFLWCNSLHVDPQFIKEYADAVPSADFHHYDDEANYFYAEENFKESLWKYKKIDYSNMIIDPNWLMPVILKRLHLKLKGRFWFVLTRPLTKDEIEADLPPDLQYTFSLSESGDAIFTIEIIGTKHKSIMCLTAFPDGNTVEWQLNTHFT